MAKQAAAAIRDRVIELRRMRAGDLLANERNWRKHPKAQRDAYARLTEEIGFAGALLAYQLADGSIKLIDGHMRAAADPEAILPVLITDLSEDEALAILATYDPLAGMAESDNAQLEALLREVEGSFGELEGLIAEVAEQYAVSLDDEPPGDPGVQLDRASELREKWQVERGMIWQIGRHRLMCGDSYSESDRAILLNGEMPAMLHTDPPYGINIVKPKNASDQAADSGGSKPFGVSNGAKRLPPGFSRREGSTGGIERTRAAKSGARDTEPVSRRATPNSTWIDGSPRGSANRASRTAIVIQSNIYPVIEGDDRPFDPAVFLSVAPITILWGANYFADKLPISSCWICWDKREGITRNNFADCEMAWCNLQKPARVFHHLWNGLHKGSQHGERRTHPTEKPVALFEEMGKFFCPAGIWLDLFAGTGAQLVAAEWVGAAVRGYGMEIEPLYVAVILDRLEQMGLKPQLMNGN